MAKTFFLRGQDCSRGYANFRGMRKWKELRRYANSLWALYEPYADSHFREDARNHFLQRYWEMYLTVALMANGSTPIRSGAIGPEFHFVYRNKRVWVEATAPSAGSGADEIKENDPSDNFSVPVERILLRYTAALREKQRKVAKDVAKGIVGPADPYVVAVNCRGIPYAPWGNTLPYMVQAVFPVGPFVLTFDRRTKRITDRSYERRESVMKKSGAQVPTTAFLDPSYASISAAIHSSIDAANNLRRLGGDFYVIHNPRARNPLPLEAFAQWPQYVYANDRLTCIPPSRRTSRRRMAPALRAVLRAPPPPFW